MSKPHSICTPRTNKDGKTFWDNIGTAWPDNKGGFRLVFNSLPIGGYSEKYGYRVEAMVFPPKDDNQQGRAAQSSDDELSDSIPF